MDLTLPAADQVEVSVFGSGFGECITIHLGGGEWAIIDSCINPNDRQPAALSYLGNIGVDIGTSARLVLVTHWDDDHIGGMARVVDACKLATVVCSLALRRADFLQFVIEQEAAATGTGSGLDELRSVLRLCKGQGKSIKWGHANLPLHPIPPGMQPTVVALSPSDDAVTRSLETLIVDSTGAARAVARRYRAPEGANGSSVAASVRVGARSLLLGADLETSPNPQAGWDDVIASAKPSQPASLVKVPHHGSDDAHHIGMWSELCEPEPVAVVTPFAMGNVKRPRHEDVDRLGALSPNLYLTGFPVLRNATLDASVERLVRRLHGGKIVELRAWGHVRCRRSLHGPDDWLIELGGDALRVGEETPSTTGTTEPPV